MNWFTKSRVRGLLIAAAVIIGLFVLLRQTATVEKIGKFRREDVRKISFQSDNPAKQWEPVTDKSGVSKFMGYLDGCVFVPLPFHKQVSGYELLIAVDSGKKNNFIVTLYGSYVDIGNWDYLVLGRSLRPAKIESMITRKT